MLKDERKHLGITISENLHAKLKYIADYEGRSISGQVVYLIMSCIRNFETENGKIQFDDINKAK